MVENKKKTQKKAEKFIWGEEEIVHRAGVANLRLASRMRLFEGLFMALDICTQSSLLMFVLLYFLKLLSFRMFQNVFEITDNKYERLSAILQQISFPSEWYDLLSPIIHQLLKNYQEK